MLFPVRSQTVPRAGSCSRVVFRRDRACNVMFLDRDRGVVCLNGDLVVFCTEAGV